MKHLILGSSGQIGYHLVKKLKSIGEEVISFDISNGTDEDLRIHQNQKLKKLIEESDFVYFLAFDIGGSLYMKKYQDTFNFISNNIKIMNNVFDVLEEYKKPFIFASSQMSNMSYSTYGILKAIGEKYTESLNGLVVKFWNVYGYETDDEKSHVITDFIKMAKRNNLIKMKTNGQESRQFLYADDCSECLIELSKQYDLVDRKKLLHITSFEWVKILDIAKLIQNKVGCEIIVGDDSDSVQQDKKNEPDDYILSFWNPTTKLEEGINLLFDEIN